MDLITFELRSRRYAVSLAVVEEVIPIGPITPIPAAPAALVGAMNVGGQVVAVLQIARMLADTGAADPGAPLPLPQEPGLLVYGAGYQAVVSVGKIEEAVRIRGAQILSNARPSSPVSAVLATELGVLHLIDLPLALHRIATQLTTRTAGMQLWGQSRR